MIQYLNIQTDRAKRSKKKRCGERMIKMTAEQKKLYTDALYYHLVRQGCNSIQAKLKVRRILH